MQRWYALVPLLLAACDGWNTTFVGPETQHVAPSATHARSTVDWSGERIEITNAYGNVEVIGVPDAKRIEVDAYPAALAQNQSDADAAIGDVAAQIAVTRRGDTLAVACPHAHADHGSALTAGTGCERIVVRVPAGSEAKPLTLDVDAEVGAAKIEGVVGSLVALATFDVHASVSPTKDATISLVNGNDGTSGTCHVVLVVPPSFKTRALLVESHIESDSHVPIGHVVTDFPELVPSSCEAASLRNTYRAIYPGAGPFPCISSGGKHAEGVDLAARIEVLAGLGDAFFVQDASHAPASSESRCR